MVARTPLQRSQPQLEGSAEEQISTFARWMATYGEQIANRIISLEAMVDAIGELDPLVQTITDPPTKTEVEAIQTAVNAIIAGAQET